MDYLKQQIQTADIALVLIGLLAILLMFLAVTIYSYLFGTVRTDRESKRLRALKKQKEKKAPKSKSEHYRDLVDKYTDPIVRTIFRDYREDDFYYLKRKLKITGLDKIWNPLSWYATIILAAIGGVLLGVLFWGKAWWFSVLLFLISVIFPTWLLNNAYNNINANLLLHFPDVIRTTAGYLASGLILARAIEETAKTASKRWKPILSGFVDRCRTLSTAEALDWMKEQVDVPQARQFFTTIRLSIDNNIDAKTSFMEQANFIDDLLDDARAKKLNGRELIGNILQPVIIVIILLAYCLPILGQIMESGILGNF